MERAYCSSAARMGKGIVARLDEDRQLDAEQINERLRVPLADPAPAVDDIGRVNAQAEDA